MATSTRTPSRMVSSSEMPATYISGVSRVAIEVDKQVDVAPAHDVAPGDGAEQAGVGSAVAAKHVVYLWAVSVEEHAQFGDSGAGYKRRHSWSSPVLGVGSSVRPKREWRRSRGIAGCACSKPSTPLPSPPCCVDAVHRWSPWHSCGMTRTRLSTTVNATLLDDARSARSGVSDAVLVDEALSALIARHRAAEVDASYAAYDDHPLDEPDEWGDLASFRQAAAAS